MAIVFASVTTLATMFFGFLIVTYIIDLDDIDTLGKPLVPLLNPRNYAIIFAATYFFALVMLSLLNWFDINRPWTRVENPELLSSVLAVPQRVLISALVPAIFATACIRFYLKLFVGPKIAVVKAGSWLAIIPVALVLALLYSVETYVTNQIFKNEVHAGLLAYVFIVGFILGASTMYVLTNDVREVRELRVA
jgi:hypothetical protein